MTALRGLTLLVLLLFIGCGPSGPTKYEVTGEVTYEGQPLKEGEILFASTEPGVAAEGSKIVDGKYKIMLQEGPKRVEIRASRVDPNAKGPMDMGPIKVQFIPARYNDQTTLEAEISSSGPSKHDFKLTSE